MSLALAHKRRTIALGGAAVVAAAASAALPYSPAEALTSPANARKHLLLQEAALDQDLARISAINGLAGRQTLKREELLPKYQEPSRTTPHCSCVPRSVTAPLRTFSRR